MRLRPPDHCSGAPHHDADPDRQHHGRELRLPNDPAHHDHVEKSTEDGHRHNRKGEPDPVVQAKLNHERERDEGAKHDQLALREVDDFSRLVNEDKSQRDQAVNAADRQPVDKELQETQPSPRPRAKSGLAHGWTTALARNPMLKRCNPPMNLPASAYFAGRVCAPCRRVTVHAVMLIAL